MSFLRRSALITTALLVAWVVAVPALGQLNKESVVFTIGEPMEIGNAIVPPGTYQIRVVKLTEQRNIIQVTDKNGQKVIASALATHHPIKLGTEIPESRFAYFPPVEGRPKTLRTWFPQDASVGHDILYEKSRALELASATHTEVQSYPVGTTEESYKTVEIEPVREVAVAPPAPEPPAPIPQPETQIAQAEPPPPPALPATATRTPLMALLAAVAFVAAYALRRVLAA